MSSRKQYQSEVVSLPQSRENSEITETLTRQLQTVIYFLAYYNFSTHFSNHNHCTTYIYTFLRKPTHFVPEKNSEFVFFKDREATVMQGMT